MAGFVAQGATCTFAPAKTGASPVTFIATRLAVNEPTAEYADMTPVNSTSTASMVLVPTGEWSDHGGVDLSFICNSSTTSLRTIVGLSGTLTFSAPGVTLTRTAILESGSVDIGFGSIVSGQASFKVFGS